MDYSRNSEYSPDSSLSFSYSQHFNRLNWVQYRWATLSYPISVGSEQVKVGVSIGVAPIDLTGDASESLRRADLAMYEAKRSKSGVLLWELGRKI